MVRRIADFVTKYCYIVFVIFLVLAGLCAFLSTKVKINHDIYSYMPESSETSQGLKIMEDEFDYGSTSTWQMMFENLDYSEKKNLREYIESVENVKSVTHDETEAYNREKDGTNYSLFEIVLDKPADSEEANKAYNTIYNELKPKYTFYQSGEVYTNNATVVSIFITVFAVGTAMVILTVMSESFVEPWLYLFAILIAVVLNKGTNIIFPSVSHITDSISMVLQMALSMDYAIMLSSRYRQEKASKDKPSKFLAMNRALRYSFGAISSSSITTVVGLIVLVLMSFTIGRDMGLVLSKGVVLSLVSIFTILPALLLLCDKAIEKTHKKTLHFKMNWMGDKEHRFRKIALPVFALIFGGAFLLKGNTAIQFTDSENNKIKDVFSVVNQSVVVYENGDEEKLAEFCGKYEKNPDVKRILCYSNTVGEQEKYNEIIAKANELSELKVSGQSAGSGEKVEAEDYLVKAIYYYYYRGDNHSLTLPAFAKYVRDEVLNDERVSDDIDAAMRKNIVRFSKFVIPEEASKPRSKAEIAELLEVDPSMLDDLYTLYYSKHPNNVRMNLYTFANFVNNEILPNPEYGKLLSAENRENLKKLLVFSNSAVTNKVMSPAELAELFGLDASQVESLLTYYNYTKSAEPTVAVSPDNLAKFALKNEMIRQTLGIDEATANQALNAINKLREEIAPYLDEYPELKEALAFVDKDYTYNDYVNLATKISSYQTIIREKAKEIIDQYGLDIDIDKIPIIDLTSSLEKLKQVYQVYQTSVMVKQLSPADFVNFLIDNADDPRISLDEAAKAKLQLVQKVITNQKTLYTSAGLANAFSLDAKQLNLVFALYDYRHVSGDPMLSVEQVINFLTDEVFNDAEYSNRLDDEKKNKVRVISGLMQAARMGVPYTYEGLYNALLPLGENLDKNQIFLAYIYHGSIYDYDENWTLSLVQFVDFLNEKLLPDTRFASRMDDDMRKTIADAKTTVKDGKEVLVGPKHSRVLIETELPAEGDTTFGFLNGIKTELGDTKNFLVGDSAMAYEMSKTFSGEMDFITIITMISIFIVVAITFKSILIPLLLVLVIQSAVYINMAYLSLTGQSIYFIALIIVQAILMGATIDYAILYTSYYLEQRKVFNLGMKDAIIMSYNKSMHSILTSASILILVTAIVGNMASAIAAKICQSISGGTLVATLIILLLLPALLATMDRFIVKKK